MGSLRVRVDGQTTVLSEIPLVALEAVEEAGPFGRAWDALRLWIR
jgi:D-alanyl-D-alanine carboxypeptidase (penicillin-binding protein 5/6)